MQFVYVLKDFSLEVMFLHLTIWSTDVQNARS